MGEEDEVFNCWEDEAERDKEDEAADHVENDCANHGFGDLGCWLTNLFAHASTGISGCSSAESEDIFRKERRLPLFWWSVLLTYLRIMPVADVA